MRSYPIVSVGLPVFDGERYLNQTINSILDQTFTDFELIIIDNASTDGTHEICRSYVDQDSRIQYHRNQENLGAAPNFNRAFELSSGRYFKWAAYDDLLAPSFLSRCVDVLDQYKDVVLCYSRANLIDENSFNISSYDPEPEASEGKPHKRFRNLLFMNTRWAGVLTFGLLRREIVRKTAKIGSYAGSDEVFVAELALHGHFIEIPERLFFLRTHPEQSTRGSLAIERDRTRWFDTSLKGKPVLPKWQYLLGCFKAINNSPIGGFKKLYCYLLMARWIFIPSHFRAMGKDLLLASKSQLIHGFK